MVNKVSKEVVNRMEIWLIVLQKVCEALVVEEQLWKRLDSSSSSEQWHCYTLGECESSILLNLTAVEALQTQAVVLFYQIFTSGEAGKSGFEDNEDAQVEGIRKGVIASTKVALGWDDNRYSQIFDTIKKKRNKYTAHYDGRAAKYEEDLTTGIKKMKSPGTWFTRDELVDFLPMARTMYDFVRKELIELQS